MLTDEINAAGGPGNEIGWRAELLLEGSPQIGYPLLFDPLLRCRGVACSCYLFYKLLYSIRISCCAQVTDRFFRVIDVAFHLRCKRRWRPSRLAILAQPEDP